MSREKINGHSFVVGTQLNPREGSVSSQTRDLHFIKSIPSASKPLRGSGLFLPPSPALPGFLCPKCSYKKRFSGEAAAPQVIDHLGLTGLWAAENQKAGTQNSFSQMAMVTLGTFQAGGCTPCQRHLQVTELQISKHILLVSPGLVEDQARFCQHGPG